MGRPRTNAVQPGCYSTDLPEVLTFKPTEEEFNAPLRYISAIHRRFGKQHGIVKIIPPSSWKPKFPHDIHKFNLSTCEQNVDQLNQRDGPNQRFWSSYRSFLSSAHKQDSSLEFAPLVDGRPLDLYALFKAVVGGGGYDSVGLSDNWAKIADQMQLKGRGLYLRFLYNKYLLKFEEAMAKGDVQVKSAVRQSNLELRQRTFSDQSGNKTQGQFGFSQAGEYTLASFKSKADIYLENLGKKYGHPATIEDLENDYWRAVMNADEYLTVEYGNDLDTAACGSGFPTEAQDPKHGSHPFNFLQMPREEGSMLKFLEFDVKGITQPWMYVGMTFSTFCWHNEDNYLYSINYNHMGHPKIWYGVPGADAMKFEKVFEKQAPELFYADRNLLFRLTTQLWPSIFSKEGVQVCRAVQQEGEFIVTFPQAYHGGFSYGFNVGEAVNFAAPDWLPFARKSELLYMLKRRMSIFSLDRLSLTIMSSNDIMDIPKDDMKYFLRDLEFVHRREACLRDQVIRSGLVLYADCLDRPNDIVACAVNQQTNEKFSAWHELRYRSLSFSDADKYLNTCEVCGMFLFCSFVCCKGSCGAQKKPKLCLAHAEAGCRCHISDRCMVMRYPLRVLESAVKEAGGIILPETPSYQIEAGLTMVDLPLPPKKLNKNMRTENLITWVTSNGDMGKTAEKSVLVSTPVNLARAGGKPSALVHSDEEGSPLSGKSSFYGDQKHITDVAKGILFPEGEDANSASILMPTARPSNPYAHASKRIKFDN